MIGQQIERPVNNESPREFARKGEGEGREEVSQKCVGGSEGERESPVNMQPQTSCCKEILADLTPLHKDTHTQTHTL